MFYCWWHIYHCISSLCNIIRSATGNGNNIVIIFLWQTNMRCRMQHGYQSVLSLWWRGNHCSIHHNPSNIYVGAWYLGLQYWNKKNDIHHSTGDFFSLFFLQVITIVLRLHFWRHKRTCGGNYNIIICDIFTSLLCNSK